MLDQMETQALKAIRELVVRVIRGCLDLMVLVGRKAIKAGRAG